MKVGDPVLDFECAYPREVCDIRGHQHRFQGIGMGSDEPVIWPDRLAGCFQLCANTGIFSVGGDIAGKDLRSEEHTSELQSLMRISYAVFCLKKKKKPQTTKQKTV